MTSSQVVKTSVNNYSSFQNYSHPNDHTRPSTTDTSGFKPFTMLCYMYVMLCYWPLCGKNMSCVAWQPCSHENHPDSIILIRFDIRLRLPGLVARWVQAQSRIHCTCTHIIKRIDYTQKHSFEPLRRREHHLNKIFICNTLAKNDFLVIDTENHKTSALWQSLVNLSHY